MRHSGNRSVQPPRAAEAVLERLLHQGSLGLSILGDLREDFARIRRRSSLGAARRWYWYQTISFGLRYLFVRKGVRPISNKNARVTGEKWEHYFRNCGTSRDAWRAGPDSH